jgi:TusA-related sulfurtransferase
MYKITINNNIEININNSIIIENFKGWLKTGAVVFEMETEEGTYYINKDNIITVRITECITITKTVINEGFPKELEG